jgi:hypothetical protein
MPHIFFYFSNERIFFIIFVLEINGSNQPNIMQKMTIFTPKLLTNKSKGVVKIN